MQWKVRVHDKQHEIDIPAYLIANTVIPAKLDGKMVLLRWNPLHQTFFISEQDGKKIKLERCFRIRNCSIEYDSQTDERRVRFHVASKDSSMVEALVFTLSQSRAVRGKVKKKRIDKQVSPLTGKVTKLFIKVGDPVRKGEQIAVIEAMKMENKILSEMTGIVKQVHAIESGKINAGDEIFSTSPLKS